jgi:soluble P-type ATPase
MIYNISGQQQLEIKTIILDLNGTLSVGGVVPVGVRQRLDHLKRLGLRILFFSGDTRGDANELAAQLGIEWKLAKTAEDKRNLALNLDPDTCVSIGNGRIDLELTKVVKLGIVTLQSEGVHVQTLLASDVVVPTINDALDLLIDEKRLISTLRK